MKDSRSAVRARHMSFLRRRGGEEEKRGGREERESERRKGEEEWRRRRGGGGAGFGKQGEGRGHILTLFVMAWPREHKRRAV